MVIISGKAVAQQTDYFADSPVWRQSSDCAIGYPCIESQEYIYYVHSDTVINSMTYHHINKLSDVSQEWMAPPPSNGCNEQYTMDQRAATLRQDGKKIWIYADGDQLLYDFDLEVGDTLPTTYNNEQNGNITVVSVDSIIVGSSYRKVFSLSGMSSTYLAEGIGHDFGLLEYFPPILECGFSLNCFALNGTTYFPDQQTQCDLTVDIAGQEKMEAALYPNPSTNGIVTLECTESGALTILIKNSLGQIVDNIRHVGQRMEVALPEKRGVYKVQLNSEKGASKSFKVVRL